MSKPQASSPTSPVSGSTVSNPGAGENENKPAATKPKLFLYFKTNPGIFKTVSVLLGLGALTLIVYGYFKAKLFSKLENINGSYRDDICRKINSELVNNHKANETVVCPSRWMVILPMYFIGIVWLATFIFLVLLICINLTKNRWFFKTDLLGHIFGGIIVTLSGLCIICYFLQVMAEDMCDETNLRREVKYWKNETLPKLKTTCPDLKMKTYSHWYFLPGGILAFSTGILYIVTAVAIIMEGVTTGMFKKEVIGPISLVPTLGNVQKQKDEQETYPQQSPAVGTETEGTSPGTPGN